MLRCWWRPPRAQLRVVPRPWDGRSPGAVSFQALLDSAKASAEALGLTTGAATDLGLPRGSPQELRFRKVSCYRTSCVIPPGHPKFGPFTDHSLPFTHLSFQAFLGLFLPGRLQETLFVLARLASSILVLCPFAHRSGSSASVCSLRGSHRGLDDFELVMLRFSGQS